MSLLFGLIGLIGFASPLVDLIDRLLTCNAADDFVGRGWPWWWLLCLVVVGGGGKPKTRGDAIHVRCCRGASGSGERTKGHRGRSVSSTESSTAVDSSYRSEG